MRLIPSDPDIETIVGRIENGDLDLQPTFQRGEVWGRQKKQKLIDSVIRDWHIPPIHVVEKKDSGRQEVLDGQQRLVSIRDFCRGELPVDGAIEPADPVIERLDGLRYSQLPDEIRRRFNQFTIRVFRIVDYSASEAGELFYRLNQPTSLTGAEQRNAFVGPVREQIKQLVELFSRVGLTSETLGFSNARMAYDDVISRVSLSVSRRTLSQKITAADLADLYRGERPLESRVIAVVEAAIEDLGKILSFEAQRPPGGTESEGASQSSDPSIRFNKATLYTWLMFLVRLRSADNNVVTTADLAGFQGKLVDVRMTYELNALRGQIDVYSYNHWLISIYHERSTSRVADVSSVMLRDACLWLLFREYVTGAAASAAHLVNQLTDKPFQLIRRTPQPDVEELSRNLMEIGWGRL